MIRQDVIFNGFKNGVYQFTNGEGIALLFRKLRIDLIKQYRLQETKTVGQQFRASYFYGSQGGQDIPILSDLETQ